MTEQNEPSMEAILASIRSILAEDEEETPKTSEEKPESAENSPSVQPEEAEQESDSKPEDQSVPSPLAEETVDAVFEEEAQQEEAVAQQEEGVFDLTADMIVTEPKEEETNDNLVTEEEDFTPEPVIPQEPMKEETLTDLIKETTGKSFEESQLLAEPTIMAATESLSHLRDIAAERQLNLGNGALTIEAIVRETIKPYLKEWLDTNLPEIVERVVRKEVAHIMDRLDLK